MGCLNRMYDNKLTKQMLNVIIRSEGKTNQLKQLGFEEKI